MANEETNSNGNRVRVEPLDLVETMRILKMEVYIYRVYNDRLIRA
jgi:hypothetical protein